MDEYSEGLPLRQAPADRQAPLVLAGVLEAQTAADYRVLGLAEPPAGAEAPENGR